MGRKQLGEQLQRLREAAGIARTVVAAELDCSEAKVRHIENGRNVPSKSELTVMVTLFGGGPDVLASLEELRADGGKRGWWAQYRLPKSLQDYVGFETDAERIANFELELIPGLLQTREYARAVHQLGARTTEPADVDRHLNARMKRQERLDGDDALVLHAIVSESALARVRGAEYAAEQYRHLVRMGERDNITLQVLPLSAGVHQSMSGGFALLDFPADVLLPVAYLEYAAGGQLVDDQAVAARLRLLFGDLAAMAMSPSESAKYIAEWI